ncbi:MAG: DUF3298 domain-containing protein [Candidatus Limivicinus sp.]
MKRILSLIFAVIMVLSLCGCDRLDNLKNVEIPPLRDPAAEEEVQETPAPSSLPEEKSAPANHVIVSIAPHKEEYFDPQNGTKLILTFSYETPAVYIEGRDEASGAVNEYIALLDETYCTGNDYGAGTADGLNAMLEMATDNYSYIVETGAEDVPMEFASNRSVRVSRADSRILSLVYSDYSYTGGAHGNSVERAYIFDAQTGERLTLETLGENYEGLCDFLTEYMLELFEADSDGYYSEKIEEGFVDDNDYEKAFRGLLRDGSWYLDDNGMVIFSDVYELGSFAAGETEFRIPYSKLQEFFLESRMPLPRSGSGSFSLKGREEIEDGSAEVIDRVVADEEGQDFWLQLDGIAYNVSISRIEYVDKLYRTAQLWNCSYMEDCLLQLRAGIPEGMPNLLLSYEDGDGNIQEFVLTQSGEDGSLILSSPDIEAVG